DQEEALVMSDRIAVMDKGRLQQVGLPHEIYEAPANPFIADFIGESNIFTGVVEAGGRGAGRGRLGRGAPLEGGRGGGASGAGGSWCDPGVWRTWRPGAVRRPRTGSTDRSPTAPTSASATSIASPRRRAWTCWCASPRARAAAAIARAIRSRSAFTPPTPA